MIPAHNVPELTKELNPRFRTPNRPGAAQVERNTKNHYSETVENQRKQSEETTCRPTASLKPKRESKMATSLEFNIQRNYLSRIKPKISTVFRSTKPQNVCYFRLVLFCID